MAAPVVEAVASTDWATASSVVLTKPTGTASGDLLLACVLVNSTTPSISAPSGWTLVESVVFSSSTVLAVYRKAAGGSEPSTYTWTFGGSYYSNVGGLRISGHDSATPVNVSTSAATAGSTSPQSPTVTTTVNDCLIVRWVGAGNWRTITEPTGYTRQYDEGSVDHVCATKTQASAGATGTADWTFSAATAGGDGHIVVAVAPTGGGGGGSPVLGPVWFDF